jgi:hypothetical protein
MDGQPSRNPPSFGSFPDLSKPPTFSSFPESQEDGERREHHRRKRSRVEEDREGEGRSRDRREKEDRDRDRKERSKDKHKDKHRRSESSREHRSDSKHVHKIKDSHVRFHCHSVDIGYSYIFESEQDYSQPATSELPSRLSYGDGYGAGALSDRRPFYSDVRGDEYNIAYGSIDKAKVPKYWRMGGQLPKERISHGAQRLTRSCVTAGKVLGLHHSMRINPQSSRTGQGLEVVRKNKLMVNCPLKEALVIRNAKNVLMLY